MNTIKDKLKHTSSIGLCSYFLIVILVFVNNKLDIKWLWHGENLFDWTCMFLAILAHIAILAGLIKLFWGKNWNKGKWALVDSLFLAITICYILLWLLMWAIASVFTFNHPY